MIRKLAVVALMIFIPLGAAACGADSTGELKKSDLTKELEKSGYTKAQADCVADKVIAADFDEDEVNKANKELSDGKLSSDDKRVQQLISIFTGCLTGS